MGQEKSTPVDEAARALRKLKVKLYQPEAHDDALNGVLVPAALGHEVTRKCVIRGIRHHSGFGKELRGIQEAPEFTRALNARMIMDNKIPTMKEDWEFPYCFWYPDVPKRKTLSRLVRRYPQLRYQVGRACAVGGYEELYHSMGLVPDVSIAEEARDNAVGDDGSQSILDYIICQPSQYAVLDDYSRTIDLENSLGKVSKLNGNTAVRSSLVATQSHRNPNDRNDLGFDVRYFDITEDAGIGTRDHQPKDSKTEDAAQFLHTALPEHLPALNKDELIVAAAFNGNVDRYHRLRRSKLVADELPAILRGIHHNVFFGRHLADCEKDHLASEDVMAVERAITARYVMSDDLSRITPIVHPSVFPYNIWFPNVASQETYTQLLTQKPEMAGSVARASIVADYEELFDTALKVVMLDPTAPDISLPSLVDGTVMAKELALLQHEALVSPNSHYKEELEKAISAREGLEAEVETAGEELSGWQTIRASDLVKMTSRGMPQLQRGTAAEIGGMYDGKNSNIAHLEARSLTYLPKSEAPENSTPPAKD